MFTPRSKLVESEGGAYLGDGSAQDIKAWRQSVRDDEHFSGLMRASYPEELELIFSGSDDEVQNMLRAQHSAQAAAMEQESKYEEEL